MKRLSIFSLFLLAAAVVVVPSAALADPYGLDTTAQHAQLDGYGKSVPALVGNVIGTGLSMVSVLFFLLMIYGGIRWMISRGNEEQSRKALDTIVAAIIGIIIVLASYAITNFVFNSVDANPTTNVQTGSNGTTNPTGTQASQGAVGDWCLGAAGPCYQLAANNMNCSGTLFTGATAETDCSHQEILNTP